MDNLPKARLENIVIQETGKELLIYDLISNKALCLNQTSRIIWQSCDGKTSFAEFRSKTSIEFSDELIWLTLNQLKAHELLDKSFKIESKINGLTRREVIRKVGLATVIAMPIIDAIVAPSSIMAQSNCQPFTCQTNFVNRCGSFDNNCGGQVTCSCTGIRNCSLTNCICPDPNAAATLPTVAPFCTGLCGQQIQIDGDGLGNLIVVASNGCLVNCNDCGGGNP